MSLRAQELTAEEGRLLRGFHVPVAEADPPLPEPRRGRRGRAREGAVRARTRWASAPGTLVGWVSAAVEGEVAALARRGAAELPRRAGAARAGASPRDSRRLRAPRTGQLLHGGRGRGPRLDDSGRRARPSRPRGPIHSDIARGFIRAEVIGWAELLEVGSLAEARKRAAPPARGQGLPRPGRRGLPLPLQRGPLTRAPLARRRGLTPSGSSCSPRRCPGSRGGRRARRARSRGRAAPRGRAPPRRRARAARPARRRCRRSGCVERAAGG